MSRTASPATADAPTPAEPRTVLDGAKMITADADRGAAVLLRTALDLDQPPTEIAAARLTATAHGVYEARVNGRPVTDSVLNPGWTAYEWRLQVQEFDVTGLLADGPRRATVEALLGNGWYRGDLGFNGADANYGEHLGLLAVLEISYRDGAVQRLATTPDWTGHPSDTTANTLYHGQRVDARLRGTTDTLPVRAVPLDRDVLVPQTGPLITRQDVLRPQRIWTSPSGRTLVDFGQNLVGWLRLRVTGPAGTEITVRHAEVLEDGELGTRPLRSARATDTFVLSGGADAFEPTLTFHGFRYAEITGWPSEHGDHGSDQATGATGAAGTPHADQIEAVAVHSRLRPTGTFRSSEPLLDQLVRNAAWGQKGNFLDIPTDCPQRDERLGWTGDIAAFAASACVQFDSADFLHKWLLDLAAEAAHDDRHIVPIIVPNLFKLGKNPWRPTPTAVWGDAAAWVPEALWRAYGDRDRLAAHYPGMVLHLESVQAALSSTGLWDQGFQFGDWLDPDAPPDRPGDAKADRGVVATACLHRTAAFAAETAAELGLPDDAARWRALAERTRAAFTEHYVEDGRIRSDCTTVYTLALAFGLLGDDDRRAAADRLAELVRAGGHRVTTGFAGTPYITWALSEHGHVDEAYRLLLERECPSWLYPITMGATTIWERWDSMLPDGSINPGEMTSFNHYALGAVVDWVYQVVAGIRPAEPGYRTVRIQPRPGPGLDWVEASYDSRVGRIEVAWRQGADGFALDVVVPDGATAEVVLPDGRTERAAGGRHRYTCA